MNKDSWELAKAFGYLTYFEVIGLKAIAGMLPKGAVCVNLGAGSGTSSLAVCEDRPDLLDTFYTVDISPESPLGGLKNEAMAFDEAGLSKCPTGVLGDTVEIGKKWDKPIDYLFIDDDHSYEHLSEELDIWLPHLADRAIVAFHDYGSVFWDGVKQALDERMVGNPTYTPMFLMSTLFAFRKGGLITMEKHAPSNI